MTNPFPNSDTNRRFYTYDYYLKKRFGTKCFKVPIDCGFTCPNIDGTKGCGGCTYCVLPTKVREIPPMEEQFDTHVKALEKKWKGAKHIVYFQDYSNTYADTDKLRELYYKALSLPDVVGISIATRADCLSKSCVELLRELDRITYLTVELGLQSSSDETAEKINRCHTWQEFLTGYHSLEGLNRCIHIIDGLPGENKEQMIKTAYDVAALSPHEVKIHLLHIIRNTEMAKSYERGEFQTLSLEQYVDIVVSQLCVLPPDTVIGRVTGDGLKDELIAPLWSTKKFVVMNEIDKKMAAENLWQGMCNECGMRNAE